MFSFLNRLFFISLFIFLGFSGLDAMEEEIRPSSTSNTASTVRTPVLNVPEMIRLSALKQNLEKPLDIFELQNDGILGIMNANTETILIVKMIQKDFTFEFYPSENLHSPIFTVSIPNYHSHALHPNQPLLYCAMSGPDDENMDLYKINYAEKTCVPLGIGRVFLGERGFSEDKTKLFYIKQREEPLLDDEPKNTLFEMDLKTGSVQKLGETRRSMPIGEVECHIMTGSNENYATEVSLSYFLQGEEKELDCACEDDDTWSRFKSPVIHKNAVYYLSDKESEYLELYRCTFPLTPLSYVLFNLSEIGQNILDFQISPEGDYSAVFIQESTTQNWVIFRGCFELFGKKLPETIRNISFLSHKKCVLASSERAALPSYHMCETETLFDFIPSLPTPFLQSSEIFSNERFYAPYHTQFIPSDNLQIPCHFTFPSHLGKEGRPALIYIPGGPDFSLEFDYSSLTQYFADQGFMFIQAGRRGMEGFGKTLKKALYDPVHPQAYLEDISNLIKALDASRHALKIDKIYVMGCSFDGATALSLATEDAYKDLSVDGFIGVGGVYNLAHFYKQISQFDKIHALAQTPNAVENLSNLSKPFLALHGDFDMQAPVTEAQALQEKGRELNSSFLQVHILKGANHALTNTREGMLAQTEGVVNFCRTKQYFISEASLRKEAPKADSQDLTPSLKQMSLASQMPEAF